MSLFRLTSSTTPRLFKSSTAVTSKLSVTPTTFQRAFHPSLATMVKVGDSIPSVEMAEGSPGNKVNLASTLTGKGLIIGVPAAFSKFFLLQS